MTSSSNRPDRKGTKVLQSRVSPALSDAVAHYAVDARSTVQAITAVAVYEYLEKNSKLTLGLERPALKREKPSPKTA